MSVQSTTIKMLSIDDKTVTTDLDRAGYRKMGILVRPAASFDEANKLLKAEKIDLIVINMDYKPVDSVNVTKHLKSQEAYAAIPIVLTSVQTAAKVRNSALDAGADLFVEQPLPRQYFVEKLKQLLDQQVRNTERINLGGEVSFTYDGTTASCAVGDLSISGILLSTDAPLQEGMRVEMSFPIPNEKKAVTVTGEVARIIPAGKGKKSGVGIRFVTFDGDSHKRLEKFIEKSALGDSKMHYYL